MECVILDDQLKPACDADTSEAVLGEMVELGEEPVSSGLTLEPSAAELAVAQAEAIFVARQQVLRRHLEAENDAFVERRSASLQQSYTKNVKGYASAWNALAKEPRAGALPTYAPWAGG